MTEKILRVAIRCIASTYVQDLINLLLYGLLVCSGTGGSSLIIHRTPGLQYWNRFRGAPKCTCRRRLRPVASSIFLELQNKDHAVMVQRWLRIQLLGRRLLSVEPHSSELPFALLVGRIFTYYGPMDLSSFDAPLQAASLYPRHFGKHRECQGRAS